MDARLLEMLSQIAKGIASQFGPNCEVVVHEISEKSAYSSVSYTHLTLPTNSLV